MADGPSPVSLERLPVRDLFHPVLRASQLRRKPVRVTVAGQDYALFRDAQGRAAAIVDRCPHRFAALSGGRVRPDGRLACPYHGWHFDRHGQGISPSQPHVKRCDVRAMQVVEDHGYLWIGERDTPVENMPRFRPQDPSFEPAGTFSMMLPAALEHALDIFSDAEHPAWVHGRLAWDEDHLDEIRYTCRREKDRTEVETSGPQRATWMSRLLGLRPGDRFNNHWVTRFDPVRAEFSMFWTEAASLALRPLRLRIALFLVPTSPRETCLHAFVFVDLRHPLRKLLMPIVKRLAVRAGRHEASEDQAFLRHMLDAPTVATGMRLGWLDRAIVYNRRLLDRLYYRRQKLLASGVGPASSSKRKVALPQLGAAPSESPAA